MAMNRYGLFAADSEYANFLAAYAFDPSAYPHFNELFQVLERLVLTVASGNYLLYADSTTMAEDESEHRGRAAYYGISPSDLRATRAPELPTDELHAFTLLACRLYEEAADEELSEEKLAAVVGEFKSAMGDADERAVANSAIAAGEPVYLSDPAGPARPDAAPVAFAPTQHDGRRVLKASAVALTAAEDLLSIHPLPPHLAKQAGAYWGEFKDKSLSSAYFMGQTEAAVKAKAAIHLAWKGKFGGE